MATIVKTPKARYTVEGIRVKDGTVELAVRSVGGKLQYLNRKRVGRPRFDSAVAHYFANQMKS
jgi:hypothetical protein